MKKMQINSHRLDVIAFTFDEIRYEVNGTEIDRNRNIGMISLMKGYVSYSYDFALYGECRISESVVWSDHEKTNNTIFYKIL